MVPEDETVERLVRENGNDESRWEDRVRDGVEPQDDEDDYDFKDRRAGVDRSDD